MGVAAEASHPSLGSGRGLGIGSATTAPTPIFHGEMNVTNVKPPNLRIPLFSLPPATTTPTAAPTPTTDMKIGKYSQYTLVIFQ